MKQGFKKALVMLLSVAMVFTFMAMPVYADDFTEAEANEVILDAPEAEAAPAAEEAEQIAEPETEVQEEVLTEEEEPAPEAIQEEATEEAVEPEVQEEVLVEEPAPEVVQEEAADAVIETAEAEEEPVAEATELADGTYKATGLSTAVLSMYHFDADAARVVIKGDNAWLITSIDGAAEANTLKRFDGMAYGKQSEILDASDETNHTLVSGTPVANVIETYGDDGETVVGRTFVLPVPKSVFESNADIYYMLKYKSGYSDSHDGDWYKASGGDYYLTGYSLEFESSSTELPGEDPTPELVEEKELEMWNEQGMFKAVSASLETYSDGSRVLVFALSGTGYIALYKGTYPEAVLDKDAIVAAMEAEESTDKTIYYQTNDDGKYEFRIPLKENETYIPLISVSKRGFDNRATQPIEEKGFYARQATLVDDETKMNLEDYKETIDFTLSTDLADFKAETTVPVYITGGPVNNNYGVAPTITMTDGTYDSVTYPSVVDGAVGTATAALTDGKFAISMENAPNKHAFKDKTPLTYTFHVAADAPYEEAGSDVERTVTFDQIAKTITVEGTALTPKETIEPAEPAEVTFTLSNKGSLVTGKDGKIVIDRPVTVTDINEDGTLTYDEALVAAHNAYYEGGAEAGYDAGTGMVKKVWGVSSEYGNYLFFINSEGIQTGVTSDKVKAGDSLYTSINADDTFWSDWYTKFSESDIEATSEDDVTVTLTGHLGMAYLEEDKQFVPLEGIQVGVWKDGNFEAIDGAVTDKDGKATFRMAAGEYLLTAQGSVEGVVTDYTLQCDETQYATTGYVKYGDEYDSGFAVGYTEKDYGNGPYPIDEVKWVDWMDWYAEGEDFEGYLLYSNQFIAPCPIMAPYANVTVKQGGEPAYPAGEYIVGVNSIKLADGADYGMFIPNYNGIKGKALITIAADGSATINYYNTRNTYPKIFLAELDSSALGKVATDEQLADPRCITAEVYAGDSSYREFTYSFDISDLGKTVPYVTLNKSNTFNKTQTAFVFDETMMSKAAFEVVGLIDALPAAADVTVRDKDAIEAARAAYEDLTETQKAEVTNLDKLIAAEEAYAALPEKDEATIAVETAMGTLIQQYYDVNDTTAAAVAKTRADYEALTLQQKAYIEDSALFKLHRAEACVAFANDGIAEGAIYDMAVDTSDNSPFVAATISPRSNAAYVYLYSVAEEYSGAALVSGTVSKSTHTVVGNGSVLKGLWMVQTSEGQGRTFVMKLTGANGDSDNYTVKVPSVYGTMAEGTYEVTAVQTPSSKMRKFERSTITSDGSEMTVEFVMPNTSYGKIYLGTVEAAENATEGFIEPTGTEATSGTTGEGNVYKIPLESMYQPIIISYNLSSKNTWTQETVEFVVDEQSQAVIDAIAALNLNTYFNVTADQREQVAAANELYQALNDNQKAVVENSNYGTLKRVVAMFQIADIVAAEIEKLPAAEDLTEADIAAVKEVKADFDNMGKSDIIMAVITQGLQNSQIEKLIDKDLRDKLTADLAKVEELEAAAVEAMIDALPAPENITENDYDAVYAARHAYDALTDAQKAMVENLDKLEACEKVTPAEPVDVTFTLNNRGVLAADKNGTAVVEKSVTVTDLDKDGHLTVDEALVAAHDAYYEGGTSGYATGDPYGYGTTVTRLWGVDTTNTLFYVNGEGIPTGVTADEIAAGDSIFASVNADDAYYADWFTKFDVTNGGEVNAEDDVTLTLTGHLGMAYTAEDKEFKPLEGIQIGIWNNGEFEPIEGAVTDADGKATFRIGKAGNIIITAKGTVEDEVDDWSTGEAQKVTADCPTMAPYCTFTVTKTTEQKADQNLTASVAAAKGIVSVGKTTTINVEGVMEDAELTFTPAKEGIITVDKNGKVTAKKVGSVQVVVSAAETDNYKAASTTVKVYVVPGATTSVTASNLATGMKVNWKKVTGATGYKLYRNGTLIATIKSGDTVTYTDKEANTNGTKYTFKVVATASTGTSKLSKSLVTYRVSRPAISALTNSSAKTMKVTWGKNSKATGYEIMYSTSKSFASGNKTITVGSASTVSRGIGGLTKGKTYYVKIRTYKTVSGKKYYSAWSVVKNVKITK
ncbi:MAG: fibronectin type III domain-containing protein [Firmicutes bacterium]|nr:fibronectin type III domain-containing protein [Bacillota bacterium]MBR4024383.1 fibronectin type III domain-containing protein [Bacillota bacterium]